ncbi:carboxypeptidase-like regulatory domain-containing protein [Engelhardtia mirabilis]|uniref:Carboxypeptidase regulatory-like domain-containing protein n=1 Tax=Engelhardtia mirabilis TaxID=2528011 RepID=A0A518BHZ9_9BACT|nr:hypothetical protein Pla133_16840 [Planctomycetes bacterium Pla133]QDV00934.1 hypothetical protein Pla86_16830 [Planctomycetes bacterium Pla86]
MRKILLSLFVAIGLSLAWLLFRGSGGDEPAHESQAGAERARAGESAGSELPTLRDAPSIATPTSSTDDAREVVEPAGAVAASRILTAQFVDPDGAPVEGVVLTLLANTLNAASPDAVRLVDHRVVDGEVEVPIGDDVTHVVAAASAPGFCPLNHAQSVAQGPRPRLRFMLQPGGAARLRVVDSAGTAVASPRFQFMPSPGSGNLSFTHGGGEGEFVLFTREGGNFAVDVSQPGSGSAHLDLQLHPPDSLDLGDVVLESGPTYRGRVQLADGTPVAGVTVVAVDPASRPPRFQNNGEARTDADGRFVLATDAPGPFEVAVSDGDDPFATTFVIPDAGDGELVLSSQAMFVVLRALGPDGPLPLERVTGTYQQTDLPFQEWGTRSLPSGLDRVLGGETEFAVLLPTAFLWNFAAEVAGADGGYFGKLEFDRRSRRVELDLLPSLGAADGTIAVQVEFAPELGPGTFSVSLSCDELGLQRSASIGGPDESMEFTGLLPGRYELWAFPRENGTTGPRLWTVNPASLIVDLVAGDTAQARFAVELGGWLVLDLTDFPPVLPNGSDTAWVTLAGVDELRYDGRGLEAFERLKDDGETDRADLSDFPRFGQRWRSSSVIPPGLYTVRVAARGFESWSAQVEILPGAAITVHPEPREQSEE